MILYALSMWFSRMGHYMVSGMLLLGEAFLIYLILFRESHDLVNLKGLFTLSWVGGQGIACFQLSKLQSDWSDITWLCFFLAYIGFGLGYDWKKYKSSNNRKEEPEDVPSIKKDDRTAGKLLLCILILSFLSVGCFVLEAAVVGFIPLFSDMPHAYSYFHISGVHYFTISCILVPAITVLYLKLQTSAQRKETVILLLCNMIAVFIPILCVSRFQLMFAVGFAVVAYVIVNEKIRLRSIVILACIMVPVYVLLTVARNHDVEYLNSIFEMKNSATPIFITQPYIYVANNYENFNCLVEQLTQHTYGIRMLFPVFALSGLKFVFPSLVAFPIYITKPELTTLTMFYDAYYDFGIVGIFIFSLMIGCAARYLTRLSKRAGNPVIYLFYGQTAIYLGLSFFTTWFSNPTTWFWFALTLCMFWFVRYQKKGKKEDE